MMAAVVTLQTNGTGSRPPNEAVGNLPWSPFSGMPFSGFLMTVVLSHLLDVTLLPEVVSIPRELSEFLGFWHSPQNGTAFLFQRVLESSCAWTPSGEYRKRYLCCT